MRKTKTVGGKSITAPDDSLCHSYVAMLARLIAADIERDTEFENENLRRKQIFLKESAKASSKRASSGTT